MNEDIYKLIREKHKSVANFARLLDVTRSAIYQAINGEPYVKKLRKKIFKKLGVVDGEKAH